MGLDSVSTHCGVEQRLNVLFVKKLYSPVGGSEAMTYQLATRLAQRGHRVRVLSLQPWSRRYQFPPADSLVASGQHYQVFHDKGVEVCQLESHLGKVGCWLDIMAPFNLLRYDVARRFAQGFDIVHNVCREYAAASWRLSREIGAPLVMTPLAHPGQAWGGLDANDVALYQRADAVVALTSVEKSWYVNRGIRPERVHVIGLGPSIDGSAGDGDAFRRQYGLTGPVVLFVGRKERYKGVDAILKASSLVWRRHPRTSFVFIGEAPWYDRLWGSFRDYTDERILNLPVVDEKTKADAFAACDIFCLPSKHETFGLVLAEAWSFAKPVIGGDIGPLREVIADGVDGLIVPQKPERIAEAINGLLDDPEKARRLGLAGKSKVEGPYSWDCVVERMEQLYVDLLRERGRAFRQP